MYMVVQVSIVIFSKWSELIYTETVNFHTLYSVCGCC